MRKNSLREKIKGETEREIDRIQRTKAEKKKREGM